MKKWTLMIGMVVGALVFGLAAFAAVPYAAQAQAGATATTAPSTTNATPRPAQRLLSPVGQIRMATCQDFRRAIS